MAASYGIAPRKRKKIDFLREGLAAYAGKKNLLTAKGPLPSSLPGGAYPTGHSTLGGGKWKKRKGLSAFFYGQGVECLRGKDFSIE